MGKKTQVKVGQLLKVSFDQLLMPTDAQRARFAIGLMYSTLASKIKASGQLVPCAAQLLSEEQQAANPDKTLLLTDGVCRAEILRELGREIEVLVHDPKSDAEILERAVASNTHQPYTPVDICYIMHRMLAAGRTDAEVKATFGYLGGDHITLGEQRYTQYLRIFELPIDVQQEAQDGKILPSALFQLTNRKITPLVLGSILKQVDQTRDRNLAEQYLRDKQYIEREQDAKKKAAMGLEFEKVEKPTYIARARTKDAPKTVEEIVQAEKDLGLNKKSQGKVTLIGMPDFLAANEKLQMHPSANGATKRLVECIKDFVTSKISEAEYIAGCVALMEGWVSDAELANVKLGRKKDAAAADEKDKVTQ